MRHHNQNHDFGSNSDNEGAEVQVFLEGKTDEDRYLEMMEAGLSTKDLNLHLLDTAVRVLQKSWLWSFRRPKTKFTMISDMYSSLTQLLD